LLAVIYLIRRALNVGKDGNYGEINNVIRPIEDRPSLSGSQVDTGSLVDTGDEAEDEIEVGNLEGELIEEVIDEPTGETP